MEREAVARRDPHGAVLAFEAFYRRLEDDELPAAEQVLNEWAQSADSNKRFVALAVTDTFSIIAALPVLRGLADDLEESSEISAPYDWAKVNRIIGRLAGEAASGQRES